MIKRALIWVLGVVVVLVTAIFIAFRSSPWPSVAITQYAFSRGDRASQAALEKHVPMNVVTRRDLAYGDGRDEKFDINHPEDTNGLLPTIVWVHGGGWVAGSKEGVGNYPKILAGHGYTTVGVEYARGFGVTYPEPVQQVNAALGYLVRNAAALHIESDAIVLAGDSAGAQIAAQLAVITTDPSYARQMGISPSLKPKQLAAVLLLSGAYDIEAMDFEGEFSWFKTVVWAYSGTRNFRNDERFRLVSVTHYVTSAFPPAFISSGNGDPWAPQAVALTRRLEELGVEVDSLFFPANYSPMLPHEYQFNLDIAAGQEVLDRMLAFVGAVVSRKN
jgi:acetyl esterase